MLELFQCKAFFRTRQSGNHVTGQAMNFFFVHLLVTCLCLGLFFFRIVLFGSRTFQDKQVESHKRRTFKAQSFGTVGHSISQVRTCPVEYRHKVVSHNVNATFSQVTQTFLIILDILHEIAGLRLDMFMHRHTLYHAPCQADFFNHLLPLHDLLHCPHFSVRDVMKGIYYSGGTCLLDVPQRHRIVRAVPAPGLFT